MTRTESYMSGSARQESGEGDRVRNTIFNHLRRVSSRRRELACIGLRSEIQTILPSPRPSPDRRLVIQSQ